MDISKRVVTQIPLSVLWNSEGSLDARRARWLDREEVRRLVQLGTTRIVVADVGLPLRWIEPEERYVFWKEEVKPHLVDEPERPFDIFSYPHGYAYLASEWQPADALAASILVLERYH